ncbi:MAG: DinB family protein [Thermomicrobiales bacterium]
MSARAEALADELQAVTDEVAQFIETVPDAGWQAYVPDDQCTVAALVCHIANSYNGMLANRIQPVVEGRDLAPLALEMLNAWNAQAAEIYAGASKELAREILAKNAAEAIAYIRTLDDDQLALTFEIATRPGPVSIEDFIAGGLIGHPRGHLASARVAAGMAE